MQKFQASLKNYLTNINNNLYIQITQHVCNTDHIIIHYLPLLYYLICIQQSKLKKLKKDYDEEICQSVYKVEKQVESQRVCVFILFSKLCPNKHYILYYFSNIYVSISEID